MCARCDKIISKNLCVVRVDGQRNHSRNGAICRAAIAKLFHNARLDDFMSNVSAFTCQLHNRRQTSLANQKQNDTRNTTKQMKDINRDASRRVLASDEEAHSGPTFQHARNNIAQNDERMTGFDDAYAVTMLRRIFSEMQKAWRMQKRKSFCAGNNLVQRCDNQSASQVCQIY